MRATSVRLCCVSLAALSAAISAPALAQDSGEIDEIIVTAQKREQNLQDVPIVVTAVDAELLRDAGVRDIKDLQILTPGLTVTSTSSEASTTARIRGVGTVGDNPGLESSVGVVIDGVYRPRNGVGFGDLGEVERDRGAEGSARHPVRQEHLGRRHQHHHRRPELQLRRGSGAHRRQLRRARRLGLGHRPARRATRSPAACSSRAASATASSTWSPATARARETRDNDQDFCTVRGQLLFRPNDTARASASSPTTPSATRTAARAVADLRSGLARLARRAGQRRCAPARAALAARPVRPRRLRQPRHRPRIVEDGASRLRSTRPRAARASPRSRAVPQLEQPSAARTRDFTAADILYRPDRRLHRRVRQLHPGAAPGRRHRPA